MTAALWTDDTNDLVHLGYGYDRAGNRLYREDVAADAASQDLDELYHYDGVYQLTDMQRGELDHSNPDPANWSVSTPDLSQQWDLDATGNWSTVTTNDDEQAREHNAANEILSADDWPDPRHDAAGNMTLVPSPTTEDADRALWCGYDAWNRMTASYLSDGDEYFEPGAGDTQIGVYAYDGLNRRIVKTADGHTRHIYLSQGNQVLEERVDARAVADEQNVWGLRYIDDLVLRDRDSDSDGVAGDGSLGKANSGLDERHYALQDANWNVVAIVEPDGDIAERYTYTAYGKCKVRMTNFTPAANNESAYDWRSLYTSRELDPETGFFYYRMRYYDVDMGRLTGRDPLEYGGGDANLYRYVGDRPTIHFDPLGLARCPAVNKDPRKGPVYDDTKLPPKDPNRADPLIKDGKEVGWSYPNQLPGTKFQFTCMADENMFYVQEPNGGYVHRCPYTHGDNKFFPDYEVKGDYWGSSTDPATKNVISYYYDPRTNTVRLRVFDKNPIDNKDAEKLGERTIPTPRDRKDLPRPEQVITKRQTHLTHADAHASHLAGGRSWQSRRR